MTFGASPYYDTDIYKLEKVQRRAARWILSRTTSVTSLLSVLNIPTLQQHRHLSRLTLFYKIINNALDIPISIRLHYQRTQFPAQKTTPSESLYLQCHKLLLILISIVSIQELLKIGIIYHKYYRIKRLGRIYLR